MRKFITPIFILFLISSGSAEIFHQLEIEEGQIEANTTIELESDDKVGYWNLNYKLPESTEIRSIKDTRGPIDDYDLNGRELSVTTNKGNPRNNELIKITYSIKRPPKIPVKGLNTYKLKFSGFKNTTTSGVIEVSNLISGRVNYGFDSTYNETQMKFKGVGPVVIDVNYGEGLESKYFTYFGRGNKISNDSQAYEIALGTIGFQQKYEKFPVGFKEGFEGSEWKAGEYQRGRIMMRPQNTSQLPILTHEVVHGLNDRLLNWDHTGSTWFDEGVASYVESLMFAKMRGYDRIPNLFGDDITYTKGTGIYTLSSRGDREDLWRYYKDDLDFMKDWDATSKNREFGYAYSELIIKNHLRYNNSLKQVYENVNPARKIKDEEEKWDIYSEHMNLRPCDYEVKSEFEQCLENINKYEYEIKRGVIRPSNNKLEIKKVDLPERNRINQSFLNIENLKSVIDNIIDSLSKLVSNLISWMITE